jgi:hypothetical protein
MSPGSRWPCRLLALLLLANAGLAAWYSVAIPLGEAPDEVPHFTYVRYLARHGRLPDTAEEHEAFQPPLYYAAAAALTFWIEDDPGAPFAVRHNAYYDVADPRAPKNLLLHTADEIWPYRGWALAWHLARLLSVALGAVTVWAVYQLGRVLFPAVPAVALAMAGLTAFTPQFLFLSAVLNNDNAATAFSALTLWQVAALLHDPRPGWKRPLLLGLLLGFGLLSKASLAVLVPIAGLAVVLAPVLGTSRQAAGSQGEGAGLGAAGGLPRSEGPVRARDPVLRTATLGLLLCFGLAALVAGWYFARNWLLHGDPLGWSFVLETNARREGPLTQEILAWLCRGVFRSFWLGWIGIAFDEFVYWILGLVCLVGAAGFGLWLVRRWPHLAGGTRWTLILLALHAAGTLASLLRWTATVLGTDQGRLIYPILPSVMLVLAAGWAWWGGERGRRAVLGLLVAGLLLLALVTPLRYIGPVHAPAARATEPELTQAVPLEARWDGIRLLAFDLQERQVQPGEKLVLDLYWEAVQPVEEDLMTLVQLVDGQGRFLMYADGSPTAGRDTTDRWQPGVPLAARHLLAVPAEGAPGIYRLTISVHPFGSSAWLPVTGPDGASQGDHLVLPVEVEVIRP